MKSGRKKYLLYKVVKNLFIQAKLNKSDDQTIIDKYRVSANITEHHIITKLIFVRIIIQKCMMIW